MYNEQSTVYSVHWSEPPLVWQWGVCRTSAILPSWDVIYSIHCTAPCVVYNVHFMLLIVRSARLSWEYTLYTVKYTVPGVQKPLSLPLYNPWLLIQSEDKPSYPSLLYTANSIQTVQNFVWSENCRFSMSPYQTKWNVLNCALSSCAAHTLMQSRHLGYVQDTTVLCSFFMCCPHRNVVQASGLHTRQHCALCSFFMCFTKCTVV